MSKDEQIAAPRLPRLTSRILTGLLSCSQDTVRAESEPSGSLGSVVPCSPRLSSPLQGRSFVAGGSRAGLVQQSPMSAILNFTSVLVPKESTLSPRHSMLASGAVRP